MFPFRPPPRGRTVGWGVRRTRGAWESAPPTGVSGEFGLRTLTDPGGGWPLRREPLAPPIVLRRHHRVKRNAGEHRLRSRAGEPLAPSYVRTFFFSEEVHHLRTGHRGPPILATKPTTAEPTAVDPGTARAKRMVMAGAYATAGTARAKQVVVAVPLNRPSCLRRPPRRMQQGPMGHRTLWRHSKRRCRSQAPSPRHVLVSIRKRGPAARTSHSCDRACRRAERARVAKVDFNLTDFAVDAGVVACLAFIAFHWAGDMPSGMYSMVIEEEMALRDTIEGPVSWR